jgi:hypothetical protein
VGGFTETLHYLSKCLTHNKNSHILWDADICPCLFCLLCEGFQQELATLERLLRNLPRPSSTPSSFALLHVVFLGHHFRVVGAYSMTATTAVNCNSCDKL